MKHQDPICSRRLDDDTPHVVQTAHRWFYFCSPACKEQFEQTRELYLVKRVDHEQRKAYKKINSN